MKSSESQTARVRKELATATNNEFPHLTRNFEGVRYVIETREKAFSRHSPRQGKARIKIGREVPMREVYKCEENGEEGNRVAKAMRKLQEIAGSLRTWVVEKKKPMRSKTPKSKKKEHKAWESIVKFAQDLIKSGTPL